MLGFFIDNQSVITFLKKNLEYIEIYQYLCQNKIKEI